MMERKNSATVFLACSALIALSLCYLLLRPFASPLMFAMVIAIVFYPLHRRMQQMVRGRNLSAAISVAATFALTVVPLTFLLLAISRELSELYGTLMSKSGSGSLLTYLLQRGDRVIEWASRRYSIPVVDLHEALARRLETASGELVRLGASLVSNAFSFIANTVIALVILFFLYRDGEKGISKVTAALPLPQERLTELQERVTSTVVANFYGGVAVGALQGTLTGLSFWVLGLESPVLWGVVTGFFSLMPVIGSGLVWVPASIVLALTGHLGKGLILAGFGITVIGTVDNIVRPMIIRKSVQLHTLLVFFSLLGGVKMFGVLGLFVGPVILSITAALIIMLQENMAGKKQAEIVSIAKAEPVKAQSAGEQ